MTAIDIVSLVGTAVGVLSLVIAAIQTYRITRIKQRQQEQLRIFINRANYVLWDHRLIDYYVQRIDDHTLHRWLWLNHQAACDLYMWIVDFYLTNERRFTYKDLEAIRHTPLVDGRWQEDFWRSVLALRRENRGKEPPPADTYEESGRLRYQRSLVKPSSESPPASEGGSQSSSTD